MKIISNKEKERALSAISKARKAIMSDDDIEKLNAVELLADLMGIIGGVKALKSEIAIIESEDK